MSSHPWARDLAWRVPNVREDGESGCYAHGLGREVSRSLYEVVSGGLQSVNDALLKSKGQNHSETKKFVASMTETAEIR